MLNQLRFILVSQLKNSRLACKISGFTLIELLVAMILAALIITPLLGFMVNILNTDRKEQAKANSEQEIRSALEYIAQDLEQAVYIYDADGLYGDQKSSPVNPITKQIPPQSSASNDDCPKVSSCTPVLVFWKRSLIKNAIKPDGTSCNPASTNSCNDSFVYSLVAYYLMQGNTASSTWADQAARIARFEIKGGVIDSTKTPVNGKPFYLTTNPPTPDTGFAPFSLSIPGNIKQKLEQWQKDSTAYTVTTQVLVDYIDKNPLPNPTSPDPAACNPTTEQRVPDLTKVTGVSNSFYACVNSTPGQNYARVYIRGDAKSRISNVDIGDQSSYLPKASIQVKGRGFLSQ